MFVTEHLEGRLQCVDGDFACINLHLQIHISPTVPFTDQLFVSKSTGKWWINNEAVTAKCLACFFPNTNSLHSELQSIADQYVEMRNILKPKELPK